MITNKKADEYLEGHFIGHLLDPRQKENRKVQIQYVVKKDIWTQVLTAAAGTALSILLHRLLAEENSVGSSIIDTD